MMTQNNELHVVLGASGGLGNAVVHELVAQGKSVRAVNRSGRADVPEGVEMVKGDMTDPASLHTVCKGASVVYHCANVPYSQWPALLMPMMDAAIEGAAAAGARLVFGDNLYMYGPVSQPMTEDLPNNATTPKGKLRAQLAERLMQAHHAGKLEAAIGRASDFFGPGVTNALMGERVFRPLLAGKTFDIIGNPDMPHTYSYTPDAARGLITLGTRDEAPGQIWHLPAAETLTTRQFLQLAAEEAGAPLKFRAAPSWLIRVLGWFNPMMRDINEVSYQFDRPFVLDHSKFERTFGSSITLHRQALRETLAWVRQHPEQMQVR